MSSEPIALLSVEQIREIVSDELLAVLETWQPRVTFAHQAGRVPRAPRAAGNAPRSTAGKRGQGSRRAQAPDRGPA